MKIDIGKKIKDIAVTTTDNKSKISDYLNKNLILYFYPRDMTPGCTTESIEFNENISKIKIVLQGAGPVKDELLIMSKELSLSNLFFLDPVPKSEMPGILKDVDVALVPLRKLDIFMGAIPSKIFEAQAMEIPLLLGVEGEAKLHFVDNANAARSYVPENAEDMASVMSEMALNPAHLKEMGRNARKYVSKNFNRNSIAENFRKVLTSDELIL